MAEEPEVVPVPGPPITDDERPVCANFYGRMFHPLDWKRIRFDIQDENVDYYRIKLPKDLLENFQNTAREYPDLLNARAALMDFKLAVGPVVPALVARTGQGTGGKIDWAKVGQVVVELLRAEQDRLNARAQLVLPPEGLVAPA